MRTLVVLAVLGLLAFVGLQAQDLVASSTPPPPGGPEVVIFGVPGAPETWAAEGYFRARGLGVRVRDVTADPAARAEHVRLGSGTLPVILVGGERLDGFREWEAERVLDRMARR